jgi:hypothetical protein
VSSSEPAARLVLLRACVEVGNWRLTTREPPDLSVVDALARLQLVARRVGCAVVVRDPPDDLRNLLRLIGLTMLLDGPTEGDDADDDAAEDADGDDDAAESVGPRPGVEVDRQPEPRELQLDEAVMPDDPVA